MKKLVKRCKDLEKKLLKKIKKLPLKRSVACLLILTVSCMGAAQHISSAPASDQYLFDRVVQIKGDQGSCSGEQIHVPSGKDYVLTAGHCRDLVESGASIIDEAGWSHPAKMVAEDSFSDLLLLEGIPGLRGLDIAGASEDRQEIRTFTYGAGLKAYKTSGVLIQDKEVKIMLRFLGSKADADDCLSKPKQDIEYIYDVLPVCILSVEETVSTAFIVPGSSGGAVVDDSGALVGVVSAGGGGFALFVRLVDIQEFLSEY